jgi:hypothetical protein
MGMEPFNPGREARQALHRFNMACDLAGALCDVNRLAGKPSGNLPASVAIPSGHPLEKFDLDQNGFFDSGVDRDGATIWGLYTRPDQRTAENFTISNTNVAPRAAISWDPWNNGKTRISGTIGRSYDRLFLSTVTQEQTPDQINYTFYPGGETTPWIDPGDRSGSTSAPSIITVDRDLRTPYKDEWSLSLERELAPEWSVQFTAYFSERKDQLQDVDINHITCEGYQDALGVDPQKVCGQAGQLIDDMFGQPFSSQRGARRGTAYSVPNGTVDLYNLNPNFNQIYKIGNTNSSQYRSYEMVLNRRLYRNWQMQLSYVWSSAIGDAESFLSQLGDDPATSDDERGYLSYDQRHVVKWLGSIHLARGIRLGGTVTWSSGTPFSVVRRLTDLDDVGNTSQRVAFPTGERNDQRNGGSWDIDVRLERSFTLGKASMEAFFEADNLLGENGMTLSEYNISTEGFGLDGSRQNFGRRWQMGVSIHI